MCHFYLIVDRTVVCRSYVGCMYVFMYTICLCTDMLMTPDVVTAHRCPRLLWSYRQLVHFLFNLWMYQFLLDYTGAPILLLDYYVELTLLLFRG